MTTALCATHLAATVPMIFPNASMCRKQLKIVHFVTEQERVVCRLAPKSLTADIVRLRLAMLRFRREIKRVIDNHVKLD